MSTETKFTKGEWVNYDGDVTYCIGKVCIIESDCMPTVVCDINNYFGKEERVANAHLIAVAPKMYEMLKMLLDGDSINDFTIDIEVAKLLAQARGE